MFLFECIACLFMFNPVHRHWWTFLCIVLTYEQLLARLRTMSLTTGILDNIVCLTKVSRLNQDLFCVAQPTSCKQKIRFSYNRPRSIYQYSNMV